MWSIINRRRRNWILGQVEKTLCALFQLPLEAQQNSRTSAFGQPLVPSEGDHSEPWIHSSLQ